MTSLLKLSERCETSNGPDRKLDADIAMACGLAPVGAEHEGNCPGWLRSPHVAFGVVRSAEFTASVDAAMALIPDDHDFSLLRGSGEPSVCKVEHKNCVDGIECSGETPALAVCAAALRVRA
jgi:hypothetical protein